MIEERWTKSKISDIAKHLAIQESRNKDALVRSEEQMHVPLWYFVSPSYKGRDYKEHMQKGIYDTIPGKG